MDSSSRAMLCSLSISMWSVRKHDPDAKAGKTSSSLPALVSVAKTEVFRKARTSLGPIRRGRIDDGNIPRRRKLRGRFLPACLWWPDPLGIDRRLHHIFLKALISFESLASPLVATSRKRQGAVSYRRFIE